MTSEPPTSPHAITCRELVELVTDYLEGALPVEAHRLVEAHLAGCEGCRRHLAQLRITIAAVGRLGDDDLPPEIRTRLLAAYRGWNR